MELKQFDRYLCGVVYDFIYFRIKYCVVFFVTIFKDQSLVYSVFIKMHMTIT